LYPYFSVLPTNGGSAKESSVEERCWLCLETFKPGELTDRHHVKPRRICTSQEKRDPHNLKRVHITCHRLLHSIHDSPKWNRDTFERMMRPRDYGHGIFANQPAYYAAD
jgi:hypothetical protein